MRIPSPTSAGEEIAEAGNPDIRVSKTMKREERQRARSTSTEEDEEEKYPGTEEERATGEDAGKSILDIGEEEPQDERLVNSGGYPTEGQGGPERQQFCHVPGGAWLQQVRSCLKNRIRAIVGREDGGDCE
ncbi:hypothetical protein NDU88_004469 [Pleurodeles waltl]|uniref:Uncharacterized protein n=1 Tax=Pleurodeles waltl TaxID=8319 RepID=A0AAV7SIV4_PLEWA|nr:hypothetical protein NDU88_004469 [Pleurodeles waltl]